MGSVNNIHNISKVSTVKTLFRTNTSIRTPRQRWSRVIRFSHYHAAVTPHLNQQVLKAAPLCWPTLTDSRFPVDRGSYGDQGGDRLQGAVGGLLRLSIFFLVPTIESRRLVGGRTRCGGRAGLFLVGVAPGPLPRRRRRRYPFLSYSLPLPPPIGRRLDAESQVPSPRAQRSATVTPVSLLKR